MCNHKLKHSSEELLYLPVQNLISVIDPDTYLKNQNKRKKETQKYKKTKIRLSKVTNTQKKVVKEKKNIKNEINNKYCKKKKKAKKLHFI
jgi:hypothetical protein